MNSGPSTQHNRLLLPSFVLSAIPLIGTLVAIFYQPAYFYLLYLLPLGIIAAILARIAINQAKRGKGLPEDFVLAIIAYYLGLTPALYFCGVMTYQFLTLR